MSASTHADPMQWGFAAGIAGAGMAVVVGMFGPHFDNATDPTIIGWCGGFFWGMTMARVKNWLIARPVRFAAKLPQASE